MELTDADGGQRGDIGLKTRERRDAITRTAGDERE
jgi:hypothetical protein